MEFEFYKYQGTGNDFVMLDNRGQEFPKNNTKLIKKLCDRKFGIGADGLILLENPDSAMEDFKMVYFNADGKESSMCGNGGRCIVAFANLLGIIKDKATFLAIDGFHEAELKKGMVSLKMMDVEETKSGTDFLFLNTGSPHHVIFTENIDTINIKEAGSKIRWSEAYKNIGGTNVNFVEPINEATFKVRTYERGVEDETLSCGTGVTAVALAAFEMGKTTHKDIQLVTPGGALKVSFEKKERVYENIWLTGSAEFVFKGFFHGDA